MVYLDKNSFEVRQLLQECERELSQPVLGIRNAERIELARQIRRLIDSMIESNFDEEKWL